MADNETVADIIAEMRRRSDEAYKGSFNYPECQENQIEYDEASEWADRLEAAHKRELSKNVSKNGADFGQLGDCAKLREALETLRELLGDLLRLGDAEYHNDFSNFCDIIDAALSTPPRNCDMPLVVDGPADNNADKAWIVFKRHNPDAYFDVPGLLRCIDWLLAPATEKEGGDK